MSGLVIVTHNGLPRSQGGLFVGYHFERPDGSWGAVPAHLAPPAPKRSDVLGQLNSGAYQSKPAPGEQVLYRHSVYRDTQCRCGKLIGNESVAAPLGHSRCPSCGQPLFIQDYSS